MLWQQKHKQDWDKEIKLALEFFYTKYGFYPKDIFMNPEQIGELKKVLYDEQEFHIKSRKTCCIETLELEYIV